MKEVKLTDEHEYLPRINEDEAQQTLIDFKHRDDLTQGTKDLLEEINAKFNQEDDDIDLRILYEITGY